ncbi:MAG: acyltransferase [Anaerolineae bacterium]
MIETERGYETATLRGGLGHKMARYMHRVTGGHSWARYIWQGTVLTLLSGLPTLLASELRARAYRTVLGGIGQGCTIERDVRLMVPRRIFLGDGGGEVVIGPRSHVGHRCLMYGTRGIQIGRDVALASNVQLICGNHTFARRDVPIRAQPVEGAPIVIEDEVRVGASAIVLGGTTLGKGSVIAPGSVVTRSLPPDSLARGIPARVVGIREESPP